MVFAKAVVECISIYWLSTHTCEYILHLVLLDSGSKMPHQFHSVKSNRDIMGAHRLLLLSVVKPSLEYGKEAWQQT